MLSCDLLLLSLVVLILLLLLLLLLFILLGVFCLFCTLVVESEVFHDCENLLHQNSAIKLRLGQHFQQRLNLRLSEIVDAQIFHTLQKAHGCQKLVRLPVDLSIKDVLLEDASHGSALLDKLVSYPNEDFLRTVDCLVVAIVIIILLVSIIFIILVIFLGNKWRGRNLLPGAFLVVFGSILGAEILVAALNDWAVNVGTLLLVINFRILFIVFATHGVLTLVRFALGLTATLRPLHCGIGLFLYHLNEHFVL